MITELEVLSMPHIDKDGVHLWVRSLDDDQPLIVVDDGICPYCGSVEWYTDVSISARNWRWTKYLCGTAAAIRVPTIGDWLLLGITPQTAECRLFDVNGVDDII